MERYQLTLSHLFIEEVDDKEIEKDIEEPYVVTVDIETLETGISFSKTNLLLSMCSELIAFMNEEELYSGGNLH
mgnify:CR=1 FL=1